MERIGLADLCDKHGNAIDVNNFNIPDEEIKAPPPEPKKRPEIPEEYKGKTWHELYVNNQLEFIKNTYPNLFDKLRTGEMKTL